MRNFPMTSQFHGVEKSALSSMLDTQPGQDVTFISFIIHQSVLHCFQTVRSALFSNMLTRERRPLDVSKMHEAGQLLLGENDFSSFRGANCQSKTARRNIHHLSVTAVGELIVIDVQANAFLLHMVRNLAGVLMDIGSGVKEIDWMTELLHLQDRNKGSVTASPKGLYFVDVIYPGYPDIPQGPYLPHLLSSLLHSRSLRNAIP